MQGAPQKITPRNDDGEARGREILLRRRPDDAVARPVDRAGEEVARHVGDKRDALGRHRGRRKFDTVHRFVVAVIDIGGGIRPVALRGVGNVALRADDRFSAADAARFFERRRTPEPRDEISARFTPKEVCGHHRELRTASALRKEDLKILGNRKEPAETVGQGFDDRFDGVRAVRHLHDRGAKSAVVEKLPLHGFEHRTGKHSGARGKIPNLRHFFLFLSRNGHVERVRFHQDFREVRQSLDASSATASSAASSGTSSSTGSSGVGSSASS